MTAIALARSTIDAEDSSRRWFRRRATSVSGPVPPLSPRLQLVRGVLVVALVLSVSLVVHLVLVSRLQHASAQEDLFDRFRSDLATGTAAIGPVDNEGRAIGIGTPVAFLEIPAIDVSEVVVYGTTSGALFGGPGVRRDTQLPGQVGTSIIMGRRAAYGGPFSAITSLEAGDEITVTTGQGTFTYLALGVRREGDPIPSPPSVESARLVLATADGRAFLPDGVVRVDAELSSGAVVGAAPAFAPGTLPGAERFLAGDTNTLWALALWIQALAALAIAMVWSWFRWGRSPTWIVFVPPLLLVGLATAGQVALVLPNLL
ncbi:MAG: class E sortase [Actinomycetota bacterium]